MRVADALIVVPRSGQSKAMVTIFPIELVASDGPDRLQNDISRSSRLHTRSARESYGGGSVSPLTRI